MLLDEKLILGGNIYYDWRRSSSGKRYHQLGLGLEAMTEFDVTALNARVNGYISLSDEEILKTWREYYFTSTGLGYTTAYTVEEPLSGLDYEVGLRIPGISNYVETWAYVGGYNYFGDYSEDVSGIMARLELIPTSFVRASYEYRHDNVHNSEHYGEVMFEVPFSIDNVIAGKNPFEGIGSRVFSGSRDMKTRMYDMVRRDVDIVTEKTDITSTNHPEKLLPGNCHCMGLVYVDNSKNAPGAGSGTLEDPYGDIATALLDPKVPSNCVFVFKGSGPYLENVTMMDNLHLWGQGYDRFNMGLSGFPVLSGLQNGGAWNGSLVLGNNTCVSGFRLENRSHDSNNTVILGIGLVGASINNNYICNDGFGLQLYNTSNFKIFENTIKLQNAPTVSTNVYAIYASGTTNNILIDSNNINATIYPPAGAWADVGGIMFSWSAGTSLNGATIIDNNINLKRVIVGAPPAAGGHGTYGIDLESVTSKNIVISGNRITVSNGSGNYLLTIRNVENADVSNNVFIISSGATEPSPVGVDLGFLITEAASNLAFHDNSISINSNVYGAGVLFESWWSGILNVDMDIYNNKIVVNGLGNNYGMSFTDGTFNTSVFGNSISGSLTSGFYFDAGVDGGVVDLGGGALGSPGNNSVSGFTNFAVDNQWGATINARNNWWGTDTPTGLMFNGFVNYTPFLTTEP